MEKLDTDLIIDKLRNAINTINELSNSISKDLAMHGECRKSAQELKGLIVSLDPKNEYGGKTIERKIKTVNIPVSESSEFTEPEGSFTVPASCPDCDYINNTLQDSTGAKHVCIKCTEKLVAEAISENYQSKNETHGLIISDKMFVQIHTMIMSSVTNGLLDLLDQEKKISASGVNSIIWRDVFETLKRELKNGK